MKKISSITKLEDLGRIQLSKSFFMREFLYSEIANWYGVSNFPDIMIQNGKQLCEQLLEPLQDKFGRVAIRSAYRSPTVNQLGNAKEHNCALVMKKTLPAIFGIIQMSAAMAQQPAS